MHRSVRLNIVVGLVMHSSVLFDKVLMQGDQFELFNYLNTA